MSAPQHLFAYGSLMCREIMHAVAGILPEGVPAVLPGHRRRVVAGEKYPGIVPDAAETVEGILYLNLPEEALVRLDAFEGEMYCRKIVICVSGGNEIPAETYGVRPEFAHRLGPQLWSYTEFLTSGKALFEAEYAGFSKLTPAPPHHPPHAGTG